MTDVVLVAVSFRDNDLGNGSGDIWKPIVDRNRMRLMPEAGRKVTALYLIIKPVTYLAWNGEAVIVTVSSFQQDERSGSSIDNNP
jgi:hypothetical protein